MYPENVRAFGLAFFIVCAAFVQAQSPRREGTFTPEGGKGVGWRIDENHGLVWDGARYTPLGIRVEGTPAAVDAANDAKIKDLLLDLPLSSDWNPILEAAERNGQRYLVRLDSLAPGAPGIAVDPAAYRIAGVIGSKHIDIPLPGAKDAFVVAALQRDGSILNKALVPVVNGRLVYDSKIAAKLENVILIYPRSERLDIPDFWDGMDDHRDALLARVRRTRFGPGFRGFVDPLGKAASLPGRNTHGVPTSAAFQAELAGVLERKYTTVSNVMVGGWSMSSSSFSASVSAGSGKTEMRTSFVDLARLVPLWSNGRGVSLLWDPASNKTYDCTKEKSQIWNDIQEAIALSASRRMRRLCAAVRRIVDVPIVQEWSGWAGLTEDRESPFDGVAALAAGETPSELVDSAARAVSTVTRWSTRGWLLATDVAVPTKDLDASLNDLAGIGLQAAFVKADPMAVSAAAAARQGRILPEVSLDPLYFPENAANPAAVQRLPGGRWWLPTPEDGNRLDLGDSFFGYRMSTPKGSRVVLWARTPGRYLIHVLQPEAAVVLTMDGSDPAPKKAKDGLNVDIGQVPIVIEGLNPLDLPIPDLSLKETIETFGRLAAYAENGRRVGTEETFGFRDAVANFDTNPGGSYATMRRQLRAFASQLSPLSWIEAESTVDTTFSESAPLPGASGERALLLRASVPSEEGFYARYEIPVRNRDEVDLWIAARIAPEHRRELEATIGGVTLVVSEAPVSSYGDGLAWYRMGKTRLDGGVAKVEVRLRTVLGTQAAIDVLVFAPSGWRPNGVAYPYGVIVPSTPVEKPAG